MLRERAGLIRDLTILADFVVIILSFIGAYWLRAHLLEDYFAEAPLAPLKEYLWLLLIILPLWFLLLHQGGAYQPLRTKTFWEINKCILKVSLFGTLILGTVIFLFKAAYLSRTFILTFIIANLLLLIFWRSGLLFFLRSVRRRGYNYRNVLIIGAGKIAENCVELIKKHADWGFRVFDILSTESINKLSEILYQNVIDEVIFAVPHSQLQKIEIGLKTCEKIGVRTHILLDWFETPIAKTRLEEFHGMPMLTLTTTPFTERALFIKRTIDIIVSSILLLVFSPLMVIIGMLIKLTSSGPIFFRQIRCGLQGRKFNFYKFRSMVEDAEQKLDEVRALNEMNGPVFKIKNDPRLTKIGKILRKTSLDELPQLFNVLKGEMSLVGPRPPIPPEVEQYEPWQRRRLSMKPGLTCLWQISGRNEIDFDEWMKLDLQYIDNWSLGLDFKILLKTIPVVLSGKGAQ
ncbi:MAG: sugar transferase [Candidatus Edwardsbacteria bacterium]